VHPARKVGVLGNDRDGTHARVVFKTGDGAFEREPNTQASKYKTEAPGKKFGGARPGPDGKAPFKKQGEYKGFGDKKHFKKKDGPEIAHDHREQKALRMKRREGNPAYSIITQLKPLWEQARQKELERDKRTPLIDQMMTIIKGKVHEVGEPVCLSGPQTGRLRSSMTRRASYNAAFSMAPMPSATFSSPSSKV
jgi:hypothetical protein